jgi:hypothetical protein
MDDMTHLDANSMHVEAPMPLALPLTMATLPSRVCDLAISSIPIVDGSKTWMSRIEQRTHVPLDLQYCHVRDLVNAWRAAVCELHSAVRD